MKITKLEILTADIDQTELFYNKALGLVADFKDETRLEYRIGTSTLVFIKTDTGQPFYHFAFNIPHNQLSEAKKWLESRTPLIPVEENSDIADFKSWNAKAIYFYDNNGNIVEFIARFDLENQTTSAFGLDSITCISEIGLVLDDVLGSTATWAQQYKLPYFRGFTPDPEFTALGSDEGLLVCVRHLRHWYLTETPALIFWTKVHFDDAKELEIGNKQ